MIGVKNSEKKLSSTNFLRNLICYYAIYGLISYSTHYIIKNNINNAQYRKLQSKEGYVTVLTLVSSS